MANKIFLVMIDPKTEEETHMIWVGHNTLDEAKAEYESIRSMSVAEGVKPIDGYLYEAENPPFGIEATELDMAKFANFFENNVLEPQQPYEIIN